MEEKQYSTGILHVVVFIKYHLLSHNCGFRHHSRKKLYPKRLCKDFDKHLNFKKPHMMYRVNDLWNVFYESQETKLGKRCVVCESEADCCQERFH